MHDVELVRACLSGTTSPVEKPMEDFSSIDVIILSTVLPDSDKFLYRPVSAFSHFPKHQPESLKRS
jgi:hypothetical protein